MNKMCFSCPRTQQCLGFRATGQFGNGREVQSSWPVRMGSCMKTCSLSVLYIRLPSPSSFSNKLRQLSGAFSLSA